MTRNSSHHSVIESINIECGSSWIVNKRMHDGPDSRSGRWDRVCSGHPLCTNASGASCSGKTLLAKHLARLLPNAILLHQDDFAPSLENIPVHPVHGVKDWDAPPTCVEWPRMRAALAHVREHGGLPDGYASFDHLNKQVEVGVDGDEAAWKERLARLGGTGGEEVLWVLVDGFVLYWDAVVASMLDVKLLLRVHRQTLKARREARATYIIQSESMLRAPATPTLARRADRRRRGRSSRRSMGRSTRVL